MAHGHICPSLRPQFFMVIVVIFAAEVSALVFGFFYHSKVGFPPVARRSSHRLWSAQVANCNTLSSVSFQLSSDLKQSMTDVFAKYGEQGGDNKAVEFLQAQVRCRSWGSIHRKSSCRF